MSDYVYYLKVEGELVYELVFGSEKEAVEYAEVNAYKDYEVVEWDCD